MVRIKNNKILIIIGIIALIIFIAQKQEVKKEAGEIVKFRTSDLGYKDNLAFNINCNGGELIQYHFTGSTVFLPSGNTCQQRYGNPIFNESLMGSSSSHCSTPGKLYVESTMFNRVVVCCDASGTGRGPIFQPTNSTESSFPLNMSMEINCVLPSAYITFLSSKNNYINGGLLSAFIMAANSWITST